MKPYFEEEGITIYHGDCREVLPTLGGGIDLVITDPPYGMDFRSNHRIVRHEAIAGDHELPLDAILLAIGAAQRAAYVFCRWDNLTELPMPRSVLVWVKNNWSMGDLKHEHGRQWEAVAFYPKDGHEFINRIPDVIHADRTGNEMHPTQKPLSLLKTIIAANVGDVVLDCFMGSGTTLRAAKDLGRKAIGIEIYEPYCEIAAKRLSQKIFQFS